MHLILISIYSKSYECKETEC